MSSNKYQSANGIGSLNRFIRKFLTG